MRTFAVIAALAAMNTIIYGTAASIWATAGF